MGERAQRYFLLSDLSATLDGKSSQFEYFSAIIREVDDENRAVEGKKAGELESRMDYRPSMSEGDNSSSVLLPFGRSDGFSLWSSCLQAYSMGLQTVLFLEAEEEKFSGYGKRFYIHEWKFHFGFEQGIT